jgi:hypothetical protein
MPMNFLRTYHTLPCAPAHLLRDEIPLCIHLLGALLVYVYLLDTFLVNAHRRGEILMRAHIHAHLLGEILVGAHIRAHLREALLRVLVHAQVHHPDELLMSALVHFRAHRRGKLPMHVRLLDDKSVVHTHSHVSARAHRLYEPLR